MPAVVSTRVQPASATVPLQLSMPSLTTTLPAGAPALEVTENPTATGWPIWEGSGSSEVMVVVVAAALMVIVRVRVAEISPLTTITVKVAVPADVGVPLTEPSPVSCKPVGSEPILTLQTYVSKPPLASNCAL